ncbi:type VI secretion system baseplate subunit TssE [Paraburkholderia edwinii]|jgi:type VI secretion system protein ImpF|uniref:Type VI secretion system baseplate subunit TssE n=1 Tax=Paraburkholderia edwinii TaxID=2861782 RepID=A0ABX8UR79_9BURK|nr:type VI secretion system baseplate subunit TssE [Paraburkholderia edwinii]QYD69445.1 type VI secretion system baseplate subunit TssE [Paraburkholderia edwinii]
MSNTPQQIRERGGRAAVPRRADTHLLPTLIDRLRDDAPRRTHEAPGEYTVSRTQMREIIQRDLAYLLNCTNIEDQIDRRRYPAAAASTVNFGVPPLAGGYVASCRWEDVEKAVKRAIRDFEPRLIADSLSVLPLDNNVGTSLYNNLAFEIRGMIRMNPYPLEFMVQSTLDLETSRMRAVAGRA